MQKDPKLLVNMHGPFVMLARWMLNWRDKNVVKVYVQVYVELRLLGLNRPILLMCM